MGRLKRLKGEKRKQEFIINHENLSDKDYKLELLYSQQLMYDNIVKIKSDVSVLTWIIVIIIAISIIGFFLSLGFIGSRY